MSFEFSAAVWTPQPDHVWLSDILSAARLALEFASPADVAEFGRDEMRQAAVTRQLGIASEAASHVSAAVREAHPEVPWGMVAGIRSGLLLDHRSVDLAEVWRVATVLVPSWILLLEPLVAAEKEEWQGEE